MSSRIGKGEWVFVYATAGVLDIAQWAIDLTGIGIAVNDIADPVIAIILGGYFQVRGVSMITHPGRLFSLFAATGVEIVGFNLPPAWIIDVWYVHKTVRKEKMEAEAAKAEQETMQSEDAPYNYEGVRTPRALPGTNNQPAYVDGVRMPSGGLNKIAAPLK